MYFSISPSCLQMRLNQRASHETAALLAERFKTFAVALIQLVAVDARQAPAPGSTAHIHGRDGRLIGNRRLCHDPICRKPAITLSRKDWHSAANRAVL